MPEDDPWKNLSERIDSPGVLLSLITLLSVFLFSWVQSPANISFPRTILESWFDEFSFEWVSMDPGDKI